MKITTINENTLEVITTDWFSGEGTEFLTVSIYNKLCKDSSNIDLNEHEVRLLIDELKEWLDD